MTNVWRSLAHNPGVDPFPFQVDFDVDSKSLDAESGDLVIEGLAADFSGEDRENENFAEGAFPRAINSFMEGASRPICFNHERKKVLGKVLELTEIPGKGVRAKARIDGAITKSPELSVLYEQIRNGTVANFSFGGFFTRKMMPDGRVRIHDMDLVELSVTATPTHPKPSFSVIAGKALEDVNPEEETAPPQSWYEALEAFERSLTAIENRGT